MGNHKLNKEWKDVVKLAMKSGVEKKDFKAFLEEKKKAESIEKKR